MLSSCFHKNKRYQKNFNHMICVNVNSDMVAHIIIELRGIEQVRVMS